MILTLAQIRDAAQRIAPHINRTPVLCSSSLNAFARASMFFKCENFQKIGAFKARGAANAIFSLPAEIAARGVTTHSSGNHAAAVARAARIRGIPAFVVMPSNAPAAKVASVKRQGAEVFSCEPTLVAREAGVAAVMARTGAVLIHPYEDLNVMAGQGTATLELIDDVPDLEFILAPIGGGGALSGAAVAAKELKPRIKVIGVEPALADDAMRSFRAGTVQPMSSTTGETIADGLRVQIGEKPFAVIREYADDIVTASEAAIVRAMRMIWEVMKIVVEPSAAVTLAAVLEGSVNVKNQRVGMLLTGGNLDLDSLPWQKT
jgi:threonine dehydratase